jgi:hypothetical protein
MPVATNQLPPMNEDTNMVVTALINIEGWYLECSRPAKTLTSLTGRIASLLRSDREAIKAMAGDVDMRKVSARRIAQYFMYEE